MAFYNPQQVVFNPSTAVIENAGRVGGALFDAMNYWNKKWQEEKEFNALQEQREIENAFKNNAIMENERSFDYKVAQDKLNNDFRKEQLAQQQAQHEAELAQRALAEKNRNALGWANYNLNAKELADKMALASMQNEKENMAKEIELLEQKEALEAIKNFKPLNADTDYQATLMDTKRIDEMLKRKGKLTNGVVDVDKVWGGDYPLEFAVGLFGGTNGNEEVDKMHNAIIRRNYGTEKSGHGSVSEANLYRKDNPGAEAFSSAERSRQNIYNGVDKQKVIAIAKAMKLIDNNIAKLHNKTAKTPQQRAYIDEQIKAWEAQKEATIQQAENELGTLNKRLFGTDEQRFNNEAIKADMQAQFETQQQNTQNNLNFKSLSDNELDLLEAQILKKIQH